VVGLIAHDAVRRARGRTSVRALDVARVDAQGHEHVEKLDCDLVACAAPPSPAYELAEQAGARVRFDGVAFVVSSEPDDGRATSSGVFATGACAGVQGLAATLAQARAAGRTAAAEVRDGR
jgi:heterodisulfide reductase subunit A-like polyferredoxin